jgi:hypothetical protein
MDAKNLADLYGLPVMAWGAIAERLDRGVTLAPGTGGPDRHTCWLATVNADGSPHVTGIGALWVEGTFFFETGARSRKARNLERDPRCTMSLSAREFDLTAEGRAQRLTHPDLVADLAARWRAGGWPAEVDGSGVALTAEFSAPSAGPPPWSVYRFVLERATAVATIEPGGATTWRFGDG